MNKMNVKLEDGEYIKNLILATENCIGSKVLIFGASNTRLVDELLKRNREITLIDIRESAFDKFREFDVDKKLVREHEEFNGLGKQDTIFFYDTLHHVENKNQKIKECFNILKKNGSIVLYEPNIYTKLIREYDQFGVLKNSMYDYTAKSLS